MSEENEHFSVNQNRLNHVLDVINKASLNGEGIFYGGVNFWRRRFLPQWQLPKEIEYSPQRDGVKDARVAANLLHLEAFCEIRNTSAYIMRNLNRLWNSGERWFFEPEEVIKKSWRRIEEIMIDEIHFNFRTEKQSSAHVRYFDNCRLICNEYQGNAANMVNDLTAKEAQNNLRRLNNFGEQMPHLYICYLLDRGIANVKNPEDILMKVDVHKARLLLNTGVVEPAKGATQMHPSTLARIANNAYHEACRRGNYSTVLSNDSCWVIGQVCKRKDYYSCVNGCPLMRQGLCLSNVKLSKKNGFFIMRDADGNRVETRRNMSDKNQQMLSFASSEV